MTLESYGWDLKNIAKVSPKTIETRPFQDCFRFLSNYHYGSNEKFQFFSHHISVLSVQWHQNRVAEI